MSFSKLIDEYEQTRKEQIKQDFFHSLYDSRFRGDYNVCFFDYQKALNELAQQIEDIHKQSRSYIAEESPLYQKLEGIDTEDK